MKDYNKLFCEYLDCVEFSIDKTTDEDGKPCYCLIDRQGANLGDIERDRFYTAAEIIERLDVYTNDYYLDDLDDEWDAYEMKGERPENTAAGWAKWSKENAEDDFRAVHEHEFDVLEMIAEHADEIDIEKVYNSVLTSR